MKVEGGGQYLRAVNDGARTVPEKDIFCSNEVDNCSGKRFL